MIQGLISLKPKTNSTFNSRAQFRPISTRPWHFLQMFTSELFSAFHFVMARFLKQLLAGGWRTAVTPPPPQCFSAVRSYSQSYYLAKVGIPEFLNGVGRGVEAHVAKLEAEIGDIQKLLETRTLRLKKLGIPCKHRKLILTYAHKYRLGLWRPRDPKVMTHK